MFLGIGGTSSVIQAAGSPARGTRASPNTLVVLVKTNDLTPSPVAFFQQIKRAGNIDIDEVLPAMRSDVRFVQRGGVEDRLHARHATPDARAVGDRANVSGEGAVENVEADDVVPQFPQRADQCFAQMAGAACDKYLHKGLYKSAAPDGGSDETQTLKNRTALP